MDELAKPTPTEPSSTTPLEFSVIDALGKTLWIVFTKTVPGTWLPEFPAVSEEEAMRHLRYRIDVDDAVCAEDILIAPYVHESLVVPEIAAQLPWNELEKRITSLVERHREDGAFAQKHGHDGEALKLYYAQAQCERILAWLLDLKPRILTPGWNMTKSDLEPGEFPDAELLSIARIAGPIGSSDERRALYRAGRWQLQKQLTEAESRVAKAEGELGAYEAKVLEYRAMLDDEMTCSGNLEESVIELKAELATERECRLANEAELRRADERIGKLRQALAHYAVRKRDAAPDNVAALAIDADSALSNPNAEGKP